MRELTHSAWIAVFCAVFVGRGCGAVEDPLVFTTGACSLKEPVYGHEFDFKDLHTELGHVVHGLREDLFEFNLCGNLTKTCDGRHDVAACLKRDKKDYVLGTQHELTYRNGKMFFSFTNGSKCPNGTESFELHVLLGCDYTLDQQQSQVTSYASDACKFYITLESPLACLPEPEATKSNDCTAKDPDTGRTFDLLSLSDVNYRTTDHNGNAFVLNVCKPVLYGENAMCPADSGVCFLALNSKDYKKKYFNYGTVQPRPTIENGELLMRFNSTTPCNATQNFSAIVYFPCDKDVRNAHPVFNGVHDCVNAFTFFTPLSCKDMAPCTVITHGNEILDIRPLMAQPFTLRMQDKAYTLGVCGSAGDPCLANDGACLKVGAESTSLGRANSHLLSNKTGAPYLLYENGAACQKSGSTALTAWTTRIDFVCATNATRQSGSAATALGPRIIENSNCQLLVHYLTPLACHEQIACSAKANVDRSEDGAGVEIVDLTPLISATENYEARIDPALIDGRRVTKSTKIFLNVCRPLVPKFGLGCPGGSAACIAEVNGAATPEKEQSLGFPLASLVAINRTNAALRYLHGGPCPTDPNSQMSAGIEFYCDMKAGRGTPILQSTTDCDYRFEWATNVICPQHMCAFNAATCAVTNDDTNVVYPLREAPFAPQGRVQVRRDDGSSFAVDICGEHRKAVTDYSQGLVNLFFATEGSCGGGKQNSLNVHLRLICSPETEEATSFTDDQHCNLVYTQRTPDICAFLGLSVPPQTTPAPPAGDAGTTKSPSQDGGHPAEHTSSIGGIVAAILSLAAVLACLGVLVASPARRNSIRRLFRRRPSAVRYSRVQSNEEANLLLEPNGEFTDSDDDMLL